MVQLLNLYIITESIIVLTIGTFAGKLVSLFYNMLSSSVVSFLPRSKCLLNSWRQLPSAVILESKKIKSVTASIFSPSVCYAVKGPGAMILVFFFFFWMLCFKPVFSLSSFTLNKRLFSFSSLSALVWYHLHIWGSWYFSRESWFQLVIHPAWHFTWCIDGFNVILDPEEGGDS